MLLFSNACSHPRPTTPPLHMIFYRCSVISFMYVIPTVIYYYFLFGSRLSVCKNRLVIRRGLEHGFMWEYARIYFCVFPCTYIYIFKAYNCTPQVSIMVSAYIIIISLSISSSGMRPALTYFDEQQKR